MKTETVIKERIRQLVKIHSDIVEQQKLCPENAHHLTQDRRYIAAQIFELNWVIDFKKVEDEL